MNNTSQKNPIASHPLASWQENSSWEKDKRLVLKSSHHIVPTKPHRKQNLLLWLYPVTSVGQNWPLIYTSKVYISLVYIKQPNLEFNPTWNERKRETSQSCICKQDVPSYASELFSFVITIDIQWISLGLLCVSRLLMPLPSWSLDNCTSKSDIITWRSIIISRYCS